jgi:hypothetical protein
MITDCRLSSLSPTMETHPSDSAAQRKVELAMLHRLEKQHPGWQRSDWKVTATKLALPAVWREIQPDAVWRTTAVTSGQEEIIVAECFAHIGKLKQGQLRKLAMDALKLLALRQQCSDATLMRCAIVVPEELRKALQMGGWLRAAIRISGEVMPVVLTNDERKQLADATRLQADGQARSSKPEKTRHPV